MNQLQTVYDRPPEGLQRGHYPAPKWAVLALGAAVVIGALVFLIWRVRRAMRAPVPGDLRPSGRP